MAFKRKRKKRPGRWVKKKDGKNKNGGQEREESQKKEEESKINRKGFIEVDGEVVELLPSATFRVTLENQHEILAHLSGKMRIHRIMLLPGDKVKVEMSPYDMTKGRIIYRY